MATNTSNTSIPLSFDNGSGFTFQRDTLAVCHTSGFISLVANIGLLIYTESNFNSKDPFDGPVIYSLRTNVIAHFLLVVTTVLGYFDKSWPCWAFSHLLLYMTFMGK